LQSPFLFFRGFSCRPIISLPSAVTPGPAGKLKFGGKAAFARD
jgi:hypothetical protein